MKNVFVALAGMVIAGSPTLATASDATSKATTELEEKARDLGSSEPLLCYRAVGAVDDEISVGLAVRLCSGTTSAVKTVACYAVAFGTASSGGLGLPRGLAIDLCRSNSLQGP